ncbi:MAG: two-component system response regulator [Desulfatiglans sp.]|jgi:putative two-component system response regulator|nr:two-component system response regulator [Desulfatiglans sp.]
MEDEVQTKKAPLILVVDDEDLNRRLMEAMLVPLGYDVSLAREGKEALEQVRECQPDLILLDIMMPGIDGFEVAKRLKGDPDTRIIPIVMVTALNDVEDRVKALEAGADDFLTKPIDKVELRARVKSLLKVKAYSDHMRDYQQELEREVTRQTRKLRAAFKKAKDASLDTIYRLSRAAEYKDEDTGGHIQRMSHYSSAIAERIGMDGQEVETILYAAPMHDVGKIGIPDKILLKPGPLNPDEWQIMMEHTTIGAKILEGGDSEVIALAEVIALTHHEKWDGSGYPKGLAGDEIPKAGRITAIADVFDALTSKRPYKQAFSVEKTFGIMREGRGKHFDPDLIDTFFTMEEEIVAIREKYLDV